MRIKWCSLGKYKFKIFISRRLVAQGLCSSIDEFSSLNNQEVVYQSGSPLNYKIFTYNVVSKKIFKVVSQTVNSNLSCKEGRLVYLKNQMVNIFDFHKNQNYEMGVELGDPQLSIDGRWLLGLQGKRLYIVDTYGIKERWIPLRRVWVKFCNLYKTMLRQKLIYENSYSRKYIMLKYNMCRGYLN